MKGSAIHPLPGATTREKIRFYLADTRTPLGKAVDIAIVALNILVCILYVLETYPLGQRAMEACVRLEMIILVFFVVEYAARLYGAPHRLKHVFSIYSLIDLAAILPGLALLAGGLFGAVLNIAFMNTIRAVKVIRIFRFLRFTADPEFFFGRITPSLLKVVRLLLTLLIIFFVSSGLFYQVESPHNPLVRNFGDAFYYAVVTLTTVGFGDITPASSAGRWVTVLMILSGIIIIPWQAGQVAREALMSGKSPVVCPNCGLKGHDRDASHCKSCGHVIFQVYEGS